MPGSAPGLRFLDQRTELARQLRSVERFDLNLLGAVRLSVNIGQEIPSSSLCQLVGTSRLLCPVAMRHSLLGRIPFLLDSSLHSLETALRMELGPI